MNNCNNQLKQNKPVIYQSNGRLDYDNERSLLQRKLAGEGYELIPRADNEIEGRYELRKDGSSVTVFIRTCVEYNQRGKQTFWFGMQEKSIHSYPYLTMILVLVWRSGKRIYLCFNNWKYRELLNHFYLKDGIHSIDIIKEDCYLYLIGKRGRVEVSIWENKFQSLLVPPDYVI